VGRWTQAPFCEVQCADVDTVPKPPWRARKEAYIAAIAHKTAKACLVSLADKVHNARTTLLDHRAIGEDVWERFTDGRAGTLWYYGALRKAFRGRGPERLWAIAKDAIAEREVRSPG